jgi:hypothetical protein
VWIKAVSSNSCKIYSKSFGSCSLTYIKKTKHKNHVCGGALRRLKQQNHEFKASLGCRARPYLKKPTI